MKVFDLGCPSGHVFEGWFASQDDFQSQKQRALVQCPVCGDTAVEKRPSAPRLNLGAAAPSSKRTELPTQSPESAGLPLQALQAAWLQMSRQLMANTEDVGSRFAQEARRMHYGEVEERGIRGQASVAEARELLEEGIEVFPLALPEAVKQTLQ